MIDVDYINLSQSSVPISDPSPVGLSPAQKGAVRAIFIRSAAELQADPASTQRAVSALISGECGTIDRQTQTVFFQTLKQTNCVKDHPDLVNRALCNAIYADRPDLVEEWIRLGAQVDALDDSFGVSLLYFACQHDKEEIREILLDAGADPNFPNVNGRTPLHFAAETEDLSLMQVLLSAGADPNVSDKKRETPLHAAAKENKPEALKLLILNRGNPGSRDLNGNRPVDLQGGREMLYQTVRMGDTRPLSACITYGVDPNLKIIGGVPLYTIAEMTGQKKCSELLEFFKSDYDEAAIRRNEIVTTLGLSASSTTYDETPLDLQKGSFMAHYFRLIADTLEEQSPSASNAVNPAIQAAFARAANASSSPQDALASFQENGLLVVEAGWKTHGMSLVFSKDEKGNDYLAIGNRGSGAAQPNQSLMVFKIDASKLTPEILKAIKWLTLNENDKNRAVDFYYKRLPGLLSSLPDQRPVRDGFSQACKEFAPSMQKYPNCAFASSLTALYACTLLQEGRRLGFPNQFPDEVKASIVERNKFLSTLVKHASFTRFMKAEEEESPDNRDPRLEKLASQKMSNTFRKRGLSPDIYERGIR